MIMNMILNSRVLHSNINFFCLFWLTGLSTFIGILVTAFATSEIFKIFFKMMFSIILLGLIHGLVILPVYLASKIIHDCILLIEWKSQNYDEYYFLKTFKDFFLVI